MNPSNVALPLLVGIALLSVSAVNGIAEAKQSEKITDMSIVKATAQNTKLTFEQISQQYIANPKTVGEARLKFIFLKIYDAKLSATNGEWKKDTPFALSLTYLRDFDGEEIASRSVDEMRDLGYKDELLLAKWFEQMRSVFPDVKEGENITGVLDENRHTHFFYEGKLVGSIDDVSFGQSFFDIWLHPKTSEPSMRKQLLGLN